MGSAFKNQLATLKKGGAWERAVAESDKSGFTNIPDGKYMTTLSGASLGNSNASGRLQVQWDYTVIEGENAGSVKYNFDGLDKEESFKYLARTLRTLGVNMMGFDPEQLEEVLEDLVAQNLTVYLTLKTRPAKIQGKDPFQNTFIDRVLRTDGTKVDQTAVPGGEGETGELTVGAAVQFAKGKRTLAGTVESIEGSLIAVLVNGERHEVDIDNLQLVG